MLEPVNPVKEKVDYDECIDITKNDLGDNVELRTGLNPFRAFIMVLKELGYTDDEIYHDEIYTVQKEFRIKVPLCDGIHETIKQDVTLMKGVGLIVDYELFPVEEIKKLRKNSKLRKKYPDKRYTYELKYVNPLKYKNVLRKLGFDVDNSIYWNNLKENMQELDEQEKTRME